jgi:hypothetical protein
VFYKKSHNSYGSAYSLEDENKDPSFRSIRACRRTINNILPIFEYLFHKVFVTVTSKYLRESKIMSIKYILGTVIPVSTEKHNLSFYVDDCIAT